MTPKRAAPPTPNETAKKLKKKTVSVEHDLVKFRKSNNEKLILNDKESFKRSEQKVVERQQQQNAETERRQIFRAEKREEMMIKVNK
jgi:ABC-type Mn2+/Zn2+ transport system ATPase subunit